MKTLVLFGDPYSRVEILSLHLSKAYSFFHFSHTNLLRMATLPNNGSNTYIGKSLRGHLLAKQWIPTELMLAAIGLHVSLMPKTRVLLLENFPRNAEEALCLEYTTGLTILGAAYLKISQKVTDNHPDRSAYPPQFNLSSPTIQEKILKFQSEISTAVAYFATKNRLQVLPGHSPSLETVPRLGQWVGSFPDITIL